MNEIQRLISGCALVAVLKLYVRTFSCRTTGCVLAYEVLIGLLVF